MKSLKEWRERRRNRITSYTGMAGDTVVKNTFRGGKLVRTDSWTPTASGSHVHRYADWEELEKSP